MNRSRGGAGGRTPLRTALPAGLGVALLALFMSAAHRAPRAEAQELPLPALRPNVLVIMTDDQPVNNTMAMMPRTRHWFGQRGTTFTNAFATTPLCCPSRASIFTGRYAHNHGVKANYREETDNLDHDSTMQRYLAEAGYRNAIFGKYLNGWDRAEDPPFFHDWAIIRGGKERGYYGGDWNVNGQQEVVSRYSTNYIRDHALRFLESAETLDARPWMMFLNVYAPHHPSLSPERYAEVDVPRWIDDPARRESNLADKPPFARRVSGARRRAKENYEAQMRSLVPVDRMVEAVRLQLRALGETEDTIAFFMSDNGYMSGEHQLLRKSEPYTPATKIPFMTRWPGNFEAGLTDRRVIGNIDLAPTVYEAAGVTPDESFPVDGMSLLDDATRDDILLEYWQEHPINQTYVPWASLRTRRFQYIEYYDQDMQQVRFREYYDLHSDPWQLENLLNDEDPANDPDVSMIEQRLGELRRCSGEGCR